MRAMMNNTTATVFVSDPIKVLIGIHEVNVGEAKNGPRCEHYDADSSAEIAAVDPDKQLNNDYCHRTDVKQAFFQTSARCAVQT